MQDSQSRCSLAEELARATGRPLTIRRVAVDSLHLDPANARAHDERNLETIQGSLARFGQVEPLIVHAGSGRIIGGNGRLMAMKRLGWKEVDIVEVDLSAIDATALGLALNRTAELADWDESALAELLTTLRVEDALQGVGFDEAEIDDLVASLQDEPDPALIDDPGAGEPPEDPVSRVGDLWLLGPHRLFCGDSTSAEDLARLMAGEKAHLLATDPPYLVDYDGTNHPAEHHRKAGRVAGEGKLLGNRRWDDYIDPESSIEFYAGFLANCLKHCVERVPVVQWHATRRQALVEQAWQQNGLLVHQTIIWAKSRGVLTRSHYLWQHEPAFYGWPKGFMPEKGRRPATTASTVWEIDQAGEERPDHPTPKPLEIFTRPIGYHTRAGEVCLEPFSGSGSQIIAAESMSRRCSAMELAPAYVDVAVRRWEKATGQEARLDGDGGTFLETAQQRGVEVSR
jgi:DNA modification methylase